MSTMISSGAPRLPMPRTVPAPCRTSASSQPRCEARGVLECVVNVAEGRNGAAIQAIGRAGDHDLLDLHSDPFHHRSVLTLVGEDAPRRVARAAVSLVELRGHDGVHPTLGVVDVVPFVPLAKATIEDAVRARDRFAQWMADSYDVPCFRYGPERSLPEVRRSAFKTLAPDAGPSVPHPALGASAVGARQLLVAYNLWLTDTDLHTAQTIARAIRAPTLRALGLRVGAGVQVSMNLLAPLVTGPWDAYQLVLERVQAVGGSVDRAELVGLVSEAVLDRVPEADWERLDLGPERTIEARLIARP